jgi:hypothetical protein
VSGGPHISDVSSRFLNLLWWFDRVARFAVAVGQFTTSADKGIPPWAYLFDLWETESCVAVGQNEDALAAM